MNKYIKLDLIHREILIYIAYKEGLLNKDDYIDYLKSQMQSMISANGEEDE